MSASGRSKTSLGVAYLASRASCCSCSTTSSMWLARRRGRCAAARVVRPTLKVAGYEPRSGCACQRRARRPHRAARAAAETTDASLATLDARPARSALRASGRRQSRARLCADRATNCGDGRRDLPAARRPAAGDRARRLALAGCCRRRRCSSALDDRLAPADRRPERPARRDSRRFAARFNGASTCSKSREQVLLGRLVDLPRRL